MLRVHFLDTLWVENFDEIALSRTVKEIEAILCFAIFGKNSKIQNGRHFLGGRGGIFENCQKYIAQIPCGLKIRRNRSISHGLGDMGKFVLCHFWQNSKIQNGRQFWGGEIFLKTAKTTLFEYPVGRKF